MSLTRRQRVRRVGILCSHYLRNTAYYYAGWDGQTPKRGHPFWRTTNSNFLDLCCLEFCKLFAEANGKHHWRKVVTDEAKFRAGLYAAIGMTEAEFAEYIKGMKFYRNKYVAHLDEELGGNYPHLGAGKKASLYLYDYLLKFEDEGDFFPDAAGTATEFYADREEEGEAIYR